MEHALKRGAIRKKTVRRMAAPPKSSEESSDLNEALQYRFVIADDHPLFRGALREAVTGLLAQAEIAEAGTYDELVELLERGSDVDLVLLDLMLPKRDGRPDEAGDKPVHTPRWRPYRHPRSYLDEGSSTERPSSAS